MNAKDLLRAASYMVRPAALVLAVSGFLLAGALWPGGSAHAAAELALDVSCDPGTVRPHETAVITCTIVLTNAGDETAENVSTSVWLSDNCRLPTNLIPPLIWERVNGELTQSRDVSLSAHVGDLGPGATYEVVIQIATTTGGPGQEGGNITFSSGSIHVSSDICWTVENGAAAPPMNLQVTKTLLTDPPDDPDTAPAEAEYEITVSNQSSAAATDLTLLDVELGGGVHLVESTPVATGSDHLGRPTWDLGAFGMSSLAAGGELTVNVTIGPDEEGYCAYSDGLAVVYAGDESYAAFADRATPIGGCDYSEPDYCEFFSPDGETSTSAPCAEEVCWAQPPGGAEYQPAYTCEVESCWFYPPLEDESPFLLPCAEDVCWFVSDAGDFDYAFPAQCGTEFCEYTAPDGSTGFDSSCDEPVCWSQSPSDGSYQSVWGCEEYGDWCWFSAGVAERDFLEFCGTELCFPIVPDGLITFGESYPISCEYASNYCWFVPPEGVDQFYSYAEYCESEYYVCWAVPAGDGIAFPIDCEYEYCWQPLPPDVDLPPEVDLPPDVLVPGECGDGDDPITPVSGGTLPVETEEATSTPAELVDGSVVRTPAQPSARVESATLLPSSRVEPIGPGQGGGNHNDGKDDTEIPSGPPEEEDDGTLADVLGLTPDTEGTTQTGAEVVVAGAPDTGMGPGSASTTGTWLAGVSLAAAGALSVGAGLALRRRRL